MSSGSPRWFERSKQLVFRSAFPPILGTVASGIPPAGAALSPCRSEKKALPHHPRRPASSTSPFYSSPTPRIVSRRKRVTGYSLYTESGRCLMKYKIALQKGDDGYSVSVPGLPGCWSQGATEDEALENIRDAIREYLAAREDLLRGTTVREVEVAG